MKLKSWNFEAIYFTIWLAFFELNFCSQIISTITTAFIVWNSWGNSYPKKKNQSTSYGQWIAWNSLTKFGWKSWDICLPMIFWKWLKFPRSSMDFLKIKISSSSNLNSRAGNLLFVGCFFGWIGLKKGRLNIFVIFKKNILATLKIIHSETKMETEILELLENTGPTRRSLFYSQCN